jgi:hypothetical protein
MRINFKYGIIAVALAGMISSCDKELDRLPFTSIEKSASFVTIADALAWRNGSMALLKGRNYGSYMFYSDVQADQLNATLDYGNRNGAAHRWSDFLSNDQTLDPMYAAYYSGINNANEAIQGFPSIVTNSATEAANLARYTGEIYFARAYYYSELIKRWAKPYNPATAEADLGVPLVVVPNLNAQPARATMKQVYDQILADLVAARTNLQTSAVAAAVGAVGSNFITIDAVNALEARVKLNMQDWAGARTAAEAVIATGRYPLTSSATTFKNMWHIDNTTETIVQFFAGLPNELSNTNTVYLGYVPNLLKFTPDFVPSQWVIDMYEDNDIRKNVYFERKPVIIQGIDYPNIWLVNKYPGNPALFTGANTNYQHAIKLLRVAEMYLISAEAGARAGSSTEAAALTRLNELRVARGLTALTGLTGNALFQAVKDERFRELAFEGHRLFDLKRWNEGFTRRLPQNVAFLQQGQFFQTLSIPAGADKFTWGFPTRDVTINPNIVQNPGW